jgi:hypothetical protein
MPKAPRRETTRDTLGFSKEGMTLYKQRDSSLCQNLTPAQSCMHHTWSEKFKKRTQPEMEKETGFCGGNKQLKKLSRNMRLNTLKKGKIQWSIENE